MSSWKQQRGHRHTPKPDREGAASERSNVPQSGTPRPRWPMPMHQMAEPLAVIARSSVLISTDFRHCVVSVIADKQAVWVQPKPAAPSKPVRRAGFVSNSSFKLLGPKQSYHILAARDPCFDVSFCQASDHSPSEARKIVRMRFCCLPFFLREGGSTKRKLVKKKTGYPRVPQNSISRDICQDNEDNRPNWH